MYTNNSLRNRRSNWYCEDAPAYYTTCIDVLLIIAAVFQTVLYKLGHFT